MKKIFTLFTCMSLAFGISAQTTEAEGKLKTAAIEGEDGWKKGGVASLNFAQTSLNNWAGGGQSSIALNGLLSLYANLKKGDSRWDNSFDLGYGTVKQGDAAFFKSDDRIDLFSKYGKKAGGNWYYAALLNFRSQMVKGFNSPSEVATGNYISRFLAPGYLLTALGMDYKPSDNFTLFVAPFTGKTTFVMDDSLSTIGAFGVDAGQNIRNEFGGYLKMAYVRDIMDNIKFQTKLDLFSNYLNNPQNIDVNWEVLIAMKVNEYITASIMTHLIYDDDIDIAVTDANGMVIGSGPRTQFKEVLAVGIGYKF